MRFGTIGRTRIIISQRSRFIRNFCRCILTVVSCEVFFQFVSSWTGIIAIWTFERFFFKMNSFVSDKMGFFHKSSSTDRTSMRPNTIMGFCMTSQLIFLWRWIFTMRVGATIYITLKLNAYNLSHIGYETLITSIIQKVLT